MMMQRLLLDTDSMSPPEYGGAGSSQEHESYRKEADFDTNMVIILGRRLVFEGGDVAATGVKKKALKQIPVAVYGAGLEIPATECPICLGEFMEGEKIRVLPQCNHGFHVRCIDVWLASHSSCPTCRRSLAEPPVVVVGRSLGGGVGGGDASVVVQDGG
ncbi:putative transcription factor C2H2 family [Helianthus annuus]|nr:putative transcription factor C2H2 family [Helianthus annuus]KAJ0475108.1 putative transcription factor C2H2 family [Helianthus annuus]KAJ0650663.1 putative transcription factor C2H2 family [Helianthus annuus]